MSSVAFHQTPMGREYYERTLPNLVRQLEQLNLALARLTERLEKGISE